MMLINADFSQRVVINPNDYDWMPSMSHGVERATFERIGVELAKTTSLVRYAPFADYAPHMHSHSEEILVVSGDFSDELGHYPEGTYLRSPVGPCYNPRIGSQGAILLIKQNQFQQHDLRQKILHTQSMPWEEELAHGLRVMQLHQFGTEHVALAKWDPYSQFTKHEHWGGEEVFVISGTYYDEHGKYPAGTWIRSPHGSSHHPYTLQDGALVMVKTGHLPNTDFMEEEYILSA